MPGNQRIDSVINKQSVEGELKWLIETLEKTHALIINTPQVTSAYKNAEGIKEQKKNTDELIASNQKLLEMQKQMESATQKIAALEKKLSEYRENSSNKKKQLTSEELRATLEESKARSDRQKSMKAEIELMNATENSINRARAANKVLLAERNNLNLATEEGRIRQAAYNKEIDKNNDFIKENVDALSKQKINIGNYGGAAKIVVDALKEVEVRLDALKEKQKGLQDLTGGGNKVGFASNADRKKQLDELQKVNAELAITQKQYNALNNIASKPAFINITEGAGNAVTELKFFQKELINLEVNEQGNTEAADKLRQHLATLTDQVADSRAEIKRMSSDSRQFDEFANSVTFLANSFQTGMGAVELFGGASKEAEEAIRKLMAVQALANGVQGMAQQLTERGTIVNKAAVFVQGLYKTAMDKTAAASVRAAAATKLLLGGLALGGAIFLIAKLVEWYKAANQTSESMKRLGEVTSKAADKYADAVIKVNTLKETIRLAKAGIIDKKTALDDYNESMGKVVRQAKSLNEAEQLLVDNADKYITFTFLKAKAEAAAGLAKEALKKSVEESGKGLDEFVSLGDKVKSKFSSGKGIFSLLFGTTPNAKEVARDASNYLEIGKKNKEEAVKTEQDKYDSFTKIQQKYLKDAAQFAKANKLNFNGDYGDDKGNKSDDKGNKSQSDQFKLDDATRKALFQTKMQQIQDEMNASQRLADNDKNNFVLRIGAARHYFDLKKQMIEEQKKFDLGDVSEKEAEGIKIAESEKKGQSVINKIRANAVAERKLIEAKSNSDLLSLNADRQSKEKDMMVKHLDDLKKKQEEKEKEIAAHKQSMREIELQNLSNWYEGELLKLDQAYAKKKKHTEKEEKDYALSKLKLQEEFQIKALQADIEFTKETLALAEARAKASGKQEDIDAVAKAKGQLASLETKLASSITQFKIGQNKKLNSDDEDAFNKKMARLEKYAAYAKQVEEIIGGFVQNSIDKQKNALQDKQDLINKNYEKEVANISASALSEEDKANRLKILEAQKFAQTEQIDRKKRQLDLEKAKFDKAANIANIIAETALAVVRALGSKPWTPANIALAAITGAIGAAQLVRAISAPLPKFKDGTESSPEGFALTDEEGPEMYIEPSGKTYLGNDNPTLRYLEKGTKIIPYEEVNKILLRNMMQNTIAMMGPNDSTSKKIDELKKENRDMLIWQTNQLKEAYKQKQAINIYISDFKNSEYITRSVRE